MKPIQLWSRLLTIIFLSFSAYVEAAEIKIEPGPYTEPVTGIQFPESIGDLTRSKSIRDYEVKGLGKSLAYNAPLIAATIYIYDRGLKHIPTDVDDKIVQDELKSAKDEILLIQKSGVYKDVELISNHEIRLGSNGNAPKALETIYHLTRKEGPVISYIYLTTYKDQFIKIRCTHSQTGRKFLEQDLKKFLDEFGPLLK